MIDDKRLVLNIASRIIVARIPDQGLEYVKGWNMGSLSLIRALTAKPQPELRNAVALVLRNYRRRQHE